MIFCFLGTFTIKISKDFLVRSGTLQKVIILGHGLRSIKYHACSAIAVCCDPSALAFHVILAFQLRSSYR